MLIVELEGAVGVDLVEVLSRRGFKVAWARAVDEAIGHLRARPETRLVVLTQRMGLANDGELLRQMAADPQIADIPVLLVEPKHEAGAAPRPLGAPASERGLVPGGAMPLTPSGPAPVAPIPAERS